MSRQVNVRLSDAEYARLAKAAQEDHRSPSGLARVTLLRAFPANCTDPRGWCDPSETGCEDTVCLYPL